MNHAFITDLELQGASTFDNGATITAINSAVKNMADSIIAIVDKTSDDIKDRGFEFNYNDGTNAINTSGATGILVTNVEGNLTGGTVNAASH